jgi:hypothetical protein
MSDDKQSHLSRIAMKLKTTLKNALQNRQGSHNHENQEKKQKRGMSGCSGHRHVSRCAAYPERVASYDPAACYSGRDMWRKSRRLANCGM